MIEILIGISMVFIIGLIIIGWILLEQYLFKVFGIWLLDTLAAAVFLCIMLYGVGKIVLMIYNKDYT